MCFRFLKAAREAALLFLASNPFMVRYVGSFRSECAEGSFSKNRVCSTDPSQRVRLSKMCDPGAESARRMEQRSRRPGICARFALTCPPEKSSNHVLFLWQESI